MRNRATRLILTAGLIPGVLMLALTASASAEVPRNVDVYGSNANAAGVHIVGATSQFSSFGDGAVNNRYPLAAVGQESAPASHAVASPADYGPIVGVVLASDPPQPLCPDPKATPCVLIPFPPHQPPPATYANAQYPNPPGNAEQTYSAGGSDHAEARASELTAGAFGSYGGNGASPFNNATAEARTLVTPEGSIHSFTHSHVSSANFGAFTIRDVDVVTDAVSVNGKGKATTKVNPGSIDKGDGSPPQEITADGKGTTFTVPGVQSITGPGGAVVPAVAPITVHIFAVSPSNTSKGAIGSVCASGTHVEFNQPSTATGGYSRDVKYILGEGCSEAFVLTIPDSILNPPAVSIDSSGDLVSSGGGTSTTTTTSSVPGSSSISDGFTGAAPSTFVSNGRAAAGKAAASGRSRRLALVSTRVPLPLAAIFFLWEALVLGAAASTVWARRLSSVPR